MLKEQLTGYIVKNLKKGYTLDALRFSLINQGYSKISVNKAIETANKIMAEEIPKINEKAEINYKVIDENEESESFLSKIKNFILNLFK